MEDKKTEKLAERQTVTETTDKEVTRQRFFWTMDPDLYASAWFHTPDCRPLRPKLGMKILRPSQRILEILLLCPLGYLILNWLVTRPACALTCVFTSYARFVGY